MKRLVDSGSILLIIASFLYAVSTVYYESYYSYFNLNPDILEKSFNQVMYHGFLIVWKDIFTLFIAIGIICLTFLITFPDIPKIHLFLTKNFNMYCKLVNYSSTLFNNIFGSRFEKSHIKTLKRYLGLFVLIFLVTLTLTTYFISIESKATKDAKEKLDQYYDSLQHSYLHSDVIQVKVDKRNKQLYLLSCGQKMCAGIELNRYSDKQVHYFPSIHYLYSPYNQEKQTKNDRNFTSIREDTLLMNVFIDKENSPHLLLFPQASFDRVYEDLYIDLSVSALSIIDEWNLFTKENDFPINSDKIYYLKERIKNTDKSDFDIDFIVHYYSNLAYLSLILGDIDNDIKTLNSALEYIAIVKKHVKTYDSQYLTDAQIDFKITVMEFNVLILALSLEKTNSEY